MDNKTITRALKGDPDAAAACTAAGIAIPCGHCGGEARHKKGFPSQQRSGCRQSLVQCASCGCRTVVYKQLPYEAWQHIDRQALAAWNRRVRMED